jgi:hypothetical protein
VATTVAGLLAATSAAAALQSSPSAPLVSTVTTTVPGSPVVFDPLAFFTDLFTQLNADPLQVGDLTQHVVPGSPADAFVTYLSGFGAARLDSRQGPLEPFTVAARSQAGETVEAVEVCSDGFCDIFGGFEVVDGRLQSFELNAMPIDDRLGASSKSVPFGPVSIGVVGAFERVTVDQLAVVIAVSSAGEELDIPWEEVVYVDPADGEIPVDLAASAFPPNIGPEGEHYVVLQFPTADLGGELVLTFATASSPTPVEVARVPVDELQP